MFHTLSRFALALALALPLAAHAVKGEVEVPGLQNPESAVVGWGGKVYVSQIGEFKKDGDGSIVAVSPGGKIEVLAQGLNDPKGLAFARSKLYVTDKTRVLKVDRKGKVEVLADAGAFPTPPQFLNDIEVDSHGTVYVTDSGDLAGNGGAIYRISPKGKVEKIADAALSPLIQSPNGLLMDGASHLLVLDFHSGDLLRVGLKVVTVEKIIGGFGGGDGLARDRSGVLYLSDWKNGRVWRMDMRETPLLPRVYDKVFKAAADIALDKNGSHILVPDMKAGSLVWFPSKMNLF